MSVTAISEYGMLLRHWRTCRGLSQLALATEAGISTRHLSFLENGRAQPSRPMVELLAGMLDVPLEDRNLLLVTAGFAPAYDRRPLGAPDLKPFERAIDFMLAQQEPYPALLVEGGGNIVRRNDAARRIFGLFVPERPDGRPANEIRSIFHPRGLRQYIDNWEELAIRILYNVHRDAALNINEERVRMRDEVMSYPGVSELWQKVSADYRAPALVTMKLVKGPWTMSFFTTVSMLGLPCDATLQELKIESFFPVDAATDEAAQRLAAGERALLPA